MFEAFVIGLREGVEIALVIGIILVVLKRTSRRDLAPSVFWGLGSAILASIGAAIALNVLPINEEAYEGVMYWVSALFVASMMWWMHRKSRTLRLDIEARVERLVGGKKEAWALGAFVFLMAFREGAEIVMFLSAVNLTTDSLLVFIGSILGIATAVVFCVMFVRGSLQVNLRRFFVVTEWVLTIFVVQLLVNGYHEFAEAGIVPTTQKSMALVGLIVRNNSLFILAIVAIPLFIWLSGKHESAKPTEGVSAAEKRLLGARARREWAYRYGAVASILVVLAVVGIVYAQELMPKEVPLPEFVSREGDALLVPLEKFDDGRLHHLGFITSGRMVRFLALKTSDGKYRAALEACGICGSFGYIQEGENLLCLNCAATINPLTVGVPGGCNPIPLEAEITATQLRIRVEALEKAAPMFVDLPGLEEIDPVCGMWVKLSNSLGFENFNGKTYYFCRAECLNTFQVNPGAYAK